LINRQTSFPPESPIVGGNLLVSALCSGIFRAKNSKLEIPEELIEEWHPQDMSPLFKLRIALLYKLSELASNGVFETNFYNLCEETVEHAGFQPDRNQLYRLHDDLKRKEIIALEKKPGEVGINRRLSDLHKSYTTAISYCRKLTTPEGLNTMREYWERPFIGELFSEEKKSPHIRIARGIILDVFRKLR
jgi:hypothetical protein